MNLPQSLKSSRLTLEQLARKIGVSYDTVKSWSIGRRVPCCRHMERRVLLVLERAERLKRLPREANRLKKGYERPAVIHTEKLG